MSVAGNVGGVAHARAIMDISWTNRRELGEAIPPYYTEHLAADLHAALSLEDAA
jgi:DNA (cytosine-5)-methyltransferase 1